MTLIYLASDEIIPAGESALTHRLIEDGDDPNEWNVLAVWASDDVYAVVLESDGDVRAFTMMPESGGYDVMEVTER